MIFSLGAAAAGWGMAWRFYRHADKGYSEPIASGAPIAYHLLMNKYYVDEGYDYVFTGRKEIGDLRLGAMGLGEAASLFDSRIIDGAVNNVGRFTRATGKISSWWDKWIIDGVCVNGPAILARAMSYPARLLQWGFVQWYALLMVAGLAGFGFYFYWFAK